MSTSRTSSIHRSILSALVLVLAVSLFGATAASATSPRQTKPLTPRAAVPQIFPEEGSLFGTYTGPVAGGSYQRAQRMADFEAEAGRKMALERVYYNWDAQWPNADDNASRDQGRTLIVSWGAVTSTGTVVKWSGIASGAYDTSLDARAADLKAFAVPVIFVFQHEPEGDPSGTASEFVSAYQHIRDRWTSQGVTNVVYGTVVMAWTYRSGAADAWYPGDAYIDVLGSDGYNWYGCMDLYTGVWSTVGDIFSDFYDFGVAHGKPMMIAEWGTLEDPQDADRKAEWLAQAAEDLKAMPEIKAVSYFNLNANCNWLIDTSAVSLAAFQTLGADPYFNPPPPLVNFETTPDDLDHETTANFTFTANTAPVTFTCSVDGTVGVDCSSGAFTVTGLSEGSHSLQVTATDADDYSGSAVDQWTVDSDAPIVTWNTTPKLITNKTSATFGAKANTTVTWTCSLDAAVATKCTAWSTYTNLTDKVHTFVIFATDTAGNVGSASYTWTVDTKAATATITSGPPALTNLRAATFTFTSNESGGTFKCQQDNGNFVICTSPKTYAWNLDGTHTVKVEAIDAAGNVGTPVSWTWKVDATKPITTITSGPATGTSTTATFVFSANEPVTGYLCQIDGSSFSSCTSPKTYTGLAKGSHWFTVYSTDVAGNVGNIAKKWWWTVK